MNAPSAVHSPIDVTNALVRLYLFLAQSLDRCVSEAACISLPESELESRLASTRAKVLNMLSANQLVARKVSQECERVRALVTACLGDGVGKAAALDELKTERVALKYKTMALSDLLAVF